MRFIFDLAQEKDEMELRNVFDEVSQESDIRVSFGRHPNIFHSISILGKINQMMITRNTEDNGIIATGVRSVKEVYINGKAGRIGYYSGLKIKAVYRSLTLFGRGIKYLKGLHQDSQVSAYLITILDGNEAVRKVLTSGRAGLPKACYLGGYKTYAIDIARSLNVFHPEIQNLKIERADEKNIGEALNFINEINTSRQFSTCHLVHDFESKHEIYRGLKPENFYVARREGKICCVVALWDQRAFKQTVVAGYSRRFKVLKNFYNFFSKFLRFASLPKEGTSIDNIYLYGNAVGKENLDVYRFVLKKIIDDCSESGHRYILAGLHEGDFLNKVFLELISAKMKSKLYILFWKDGEEFISSLDEKIPYLEIATL